VVYVTEVSEPHEPDFDTIKEAVADDWVAEHSIELALESLEALRDAFGTAPEDDPETEEDESAGWNPSATDEVFRATAAPLDYVVQERPWLERFELPGDFDDATEADKHFRTAFAWYGLEVDQVPPPEKNAMGTHAYLARYVGERPKPMTEIKASDLAGLRAQAVGQVLASFADSMLRVDSDWFKSTFKVDMAVWKRRTENPTGFPDDFEGDGAQ
jgi:hypothetical protein